MGVREAAHENQQRAAWDRQSINELKEFMKPRLCSSAGTLDRMTLNKFRKVNTRLWMVQHLKEEVWRVSMVDVIRMPVIGVLDSIAWNLNKQRAEFLAGDDATDKVY